MRLHRLRITSLAAIGNVDLELGPGLNVLYGPNDLGKSTVATAIRLGLLLPHTSTHCDPYVSWTGADDPIVEITFETETQRIWRVRKQFGRGGMSLLQESKNGQDFDDLERGRKVDGKLREILRWGIPEPGGSGGSKGMPESFLATVLLSPQDDVSAVLRDSLQGDLTGSGKEQIAAALQAVAQDPLFLALLRNTQAHRDKAYTDKGSKKTARGSVFKDAAERLNAARDEKDKLHRIVADSEGAETLLRDLTNRRTGKQSELASAQASLGELESLAAQSACRLAAEQQVTAAQEEVQRIRSIGTEVDAADKAVAALLKKIENAEHRLTDARDLQVQTAAKLATAEESARQQEPDAGVTETVLRQQLEIRRAAAEEAARQAQQRIDIALDARNLIAAVANAELAFKDQQAVANSAINAASIADDKVRTVEAALQRCDLLERALDVQLADKQAADAQTAVNQEAALRKTLDTASSERVSLAAQRAAIKVPASGAIGPMRRLATDLAAARGALEVGFVVTVAPKSSLNLLLRTDGNAAEARSASAPFDVEANTEIEISIEEVGTIRVRGGRRETQEKAEALENRWSREVVPHLITAGVTDLDGLDGKMAEARELDAAIKSKDAEMESLGVQLAALFGAVETLRVAANRAETCRAALGDVRLETLRSDLKALGSEARTALRKQRQKLLNEADAARATANKAASARTLADERTHQSKLTLERAIASRDAVLPGFPEGVDAALIAANSVLSASGAEKERVNIDLASLDRAMVERKKRLEELLTGARARASEANLAVDKAQQDVTAARTDHALNDGRLMELRKLRDAENMAEAEALLMSAIQQHDSLPAPGRIVSNDELMAAQNRLAAIKLELEGIERDIQRAHGALEQVGGAVARERLHDATEAFELAEREEREIEAEYEAWKLLLEQMKEADAAQASNLGQALVPAIASHFSQLTQQRYQTVQLTAQLATEGIVASGALRSADRFSIGTRDQLSTLYRLSLAEYLRTAIVLDDQLVQSDETRMDWFRTLLAEKARKFQIIVFTCRPSDYLSRAALVPEGSAVHSDTDDGFVRAIDLGRALRRPLVSTLHNLQCFGIS